MLPLLKVCGAHSVSHQVRPIIGMIIFIIIIIILITMIAIYYYYCFY